MPRGKKHAPGAKAEQCYLEVIHLLFDIIKVKRVMPVQEIGEIGSDLQARLIRKKAPDSARLVGELVEHVVGK